MKRLTGFQLYILGVFLLCSCKKAENKVYEGIWHLSGEKKSVVYPCWPCSIPTDPTTTTESFSQNLTIKEESGKRIRFYGLETNALMTQEDNCSYQSYCGFYGTVLADGFEITTVTDPGGSLNGSAILRGDSLELTYSYHYRNRTYSYMLKGKKQ
jgi:hypothetical protein